MYGTTDSSVEITEKEFIRMTDKSLFYTTSNGRERKELIDTSYCKWYKTKEEAIARIQYQAKRNLESAEFRISKAKEYYEQAMNLKP